MEPNESAKNKEPISMVFAAIGCFIVASIFFKNSDYKEALETKHWNKTTGIITDAGIHDKRQGLNINFVSVYLSYSYQVGNVSYQGNAYVRGGESMNFPSRSEAQTFLSQFPKGKPVTVYYNFRQPAVAVLKKGFTKYHFAQLIGASIMAGVGLILLYLFLKSWNYLPKNLEFTK